MALKIEAEGAKATGREFLIPLDQIVIGENLARAMDPPPDVFEEFYRSVANEGQRQAAEVQLLADKRVKLVDGYQRYRALKRKQKETGEPQLMKVSVFQGNDEEAFFRAVSANKDRIPPTPVDEAKQIRMMMEKYGKSIDDVCKIFGGKSPAWVTTQRLPLLNLSKKEQMRLVTDFYKVDTALILAKLTATHTEEEREEIVQQAAQIESEEKGVPVPVPTEQELIKKLEAPAEPPKKPAAPEPKTGGKPELVPTKKAAAKTAAPSVSASSLLQAASNNSALGDGAPELKMKELKRYIFEVLEEHQDDAVGGFYKELEKFIQRKNSRKQMDNRNVKYLIGG
jgi:ParB-like chromosome segregation protein Spo0J